MKALLDMPVSRSLLSVLEAHRAWKDQCAGTQVTL